jgi:hypothetical protein
MPGSSWRVVAEANDLNPRSVRLFKYTGAPSESWVDTDDVTRLDGRRLPGRTDDEHGPAKGEGQRG